MEWTTGPSQWVTIFVYIYVYMRKFTEPQHYFATAEENWDIGAARKDANKIIIYLTHEIDQRPNYLNLS